MREKAIFFGNGMLAEYALEVISHRCEVIFHARTREDLGEACRLKREFSEAHGILASFGVIIKPDVLELFEPEGILNVHPSALPQYRGASPIESAILDGNTEFSVSVMKLVKAMDAGPIYFQETLAGLPLDKPTIYRALATAGAEWISENLGKLPKPVPQDDTLATFCGKLDKTMSLLTPETDTAEKTLRKIVAFAGFPKPKYTFCGVKCIVLEAHIAEVGETALIPLECADGAILAIDRLQPEGRKAMDAKAFLNGYGR
ncbi:methionyl-tRNA formyltransferase [Candidatus Saccharibacteria bacterium]|nr:methionyl-tRNA formyltransferase [Candidatus Saccharibacteria bacterium]